MQDDRCAHRQARSTPLSLSSATGGAWRLRPAPWTSIFKAMLWVNRESHFESTEQARSFFDAPWRSTQPTFDALAGI